MAFDKIAILDVRGVWDVGVACANQYEFQGGFCNYETLQFLNIVAINCLKNE